MIKAFIFDFDGVLNDTYAQKLIAIEKCLLPIVKNKKKAKKYAKEILIIIERIDTYNPLLPMKEIVRNGFEEFFKKSKIKYKKKDIERLLQNYFSTRKKIEKIPPPARKIVKKLSRKYKIFILTHRRMKDIKEIVRKCKLDTFINKIYSTLDLGFRKPSIDVLKLILKENKLKPNECVMIGDEIKLDILPAKMIGMKTVLYSRFVDHVIIRFKELGCKKVV